MINSLIIFTPITELVISVYVLGWGLLLSNCFYKNEEIKNNLSEISIYGFCLILPLTQFINFFYPISTSIFFITFFFSALIIFRFKNSIKINFFKWIAKLAVFFVLLMPLKYVIKGNEDLYYHLPKVELINQFKIILGIAHFDSSLSFTNGWAHISSAINFFNGSEKNLYITTFVFFVLSLVTFYNYLVKEKTKKLKMIILIILSFLIIKFYRIQEFGNDYQAIILLLFSQVLIFKFYLQKENTKYLINKIIFYAFFAFMFRIYAIFIIPTLLVLLKNKTNIINLIDKKLIIFFFTTFSLTLITSYLNSGCLFMPLKQTCLNKNSTSWTYINKIENLNTRLKSFNTSYFSYKKEVPKPVTEQEWVKKYTWFKYHVTSERFVLPIIKSSLIILVLFFLIVFVINRKNVTMRSLNKPDFFFISLVLSSFLFWLLNTPLLRAGGYSFLTFLFIVILFLKFDFNEIVNKKKINIFLISILSISILLNVNRIYKEGKKYESMSPFFFTEWGKLHKTKYQNKELLKNLLLKGDLDKNKLNLKITKSNDWFIIKE